MIYKFEVVEGETTYQCERVVTGTKVLTQRINVVGCGSKEDSADYGATAHPVETMSGIAQLIADEIIRETRIRRSSKR